MCGFPNKGYVLTTVKTKASRRQIPIPKKVVKELLKHKKMQNELRLRFGEGYPNLDLVNCTETGTEMGPRNVIRVFKRVCTSANFTSIRFHDIRHTHASILTLGIYSHLVPNEDNDVADIFDEAVQKER